MSSTRELKKRLALHNSVVAASTKPRRPFKLVFYEAYRNRSDAGDNSLSRAAQVC